MDLNAEVDQLVRQSQTWIPLIMEYGSRVLLALLTLAVGWWIINKVSARLGKLVGLRNADLALQGFISTLANDGVGLAPYHDWESKVPAELTAELETVKQGIIDGTIKTGWPIE